VSSAWKVTASSFGVGGWAGCYIVGVSGKCNQIKKKDICENNNA